MAMILVAAGTFLLCWLLDKGFQKAFRSAPQHMSGKSVRLNKYNGLAGVILTLLGIIAMIFGGEMIMLVGGGIGIPPMLGCAKFAGGKCTAILGGRNADKIILTDDFNTNCAKVLVATDDGSMGHHGFVDALVRQELGEDANYDGVLACGPKPMLRNVAKVAEEFDIPCLVSMEERMGCGVGACLVCACDMADGSRKHVCKDGPVFDSKEVDWNA